jgi:DNA-binding response OmpR family regulator
MACILVIDDDHAIQITLKVALEDEGHDVVCASDGEQGLRALANKTPDLVVTDLIMPNKEGIETIIEIRVRDPKTPVLAISGGGRLSNVDFLKMATKVGANEILAKPFERYDLIAAVRRLLSS